MKIAFYYPTQAAPTTQWGPARPARLPLEENIDYPEQLRGETAGGTVHIQSKGPLQTTLELKFERLSQTDRDAALVFYQAVEKAFRTFEFVAGEDPPRTMRWISEFHFQEVAPGWFSGTVSLREE